MKVVRATWKNFKFVRMYVFSNAFCGCILKPKTARMGKRRKSNIVDSPLGEIVIPNIPFHELIFRDWSLWEGKTAIVCGVTGRKYTFQKLKSSSQSLAASLQNRFNLKKGDFLAVILPNCPEYPIAILACSQLGVIPTTVNPTYTVDEISSQISECNVKSIITDHSNHRKCAEVANKLALRIPMIVVRTTREAPLPEGAIDAFDLFDPSTSGRPRLVDLTPDDALVLPFSSGTTGFPKGVVLTHGNVVSNLVQISHPDTAIVGPTTRFHQDTILGVLPMFHIYGLVIATFYSLKEGCRLVVLPRFEPRFYITNVVKKRVNILYVVPPLLDFLSHDRVHSKYLRNVKYLINAAAPMALQSAYKILEKAPNVKIGQGYGMTEASPALAHTSTKRMQKLSAIGIPIASTKFKVNSLDTGEALPKGKEGELCAWGPQVMKGYLNRPDDTQNAFDADGWLRTGDIAYYDDDGDFFIVDRFKNLIKVKGFQVAPAELEEALLVHPKIKEAAVIGVKHQEFGEIPRAFVVLVKGAHMTEEEVKEIISKRMSSYKHLKGGVRFIDELPKNSAGKVLKKMLEGLE